MAGAFDWLDTLTNQIGVVAGKAVDVVGNVATVKATAGATADQTPVGGTSPLQTAVAGMPGWVPYALGGALLALGAYMAFRKR